MPGVNFWTDEKRQYLIDYMKRWKPGMEYPPSIEGLSKSTVRHEISVLGIGIRHRENEPLTDEEAEEIKRYLSSGYKIEDIAKIIRRSVKSVRNIAKTIESETESRGLYVAYDEDKIVVCVGNPKDIALYYGISEEKVIEISKIDEEKKAFPIFYAGEDPNSV